MLVSVMVTKLLTNNRGIVGVRVDTGETVKASFNLIGSGCKVGEVTEIHPSRFQ